MRTRKVKEAQEIWRRMPRQIASDLRRFFGLNIRDWHRGTTEGGELVLSSYELLELFGAHIDDKPDTGDVHPDAVVVVREAGVVSRRRYGDLATEGTREIHVDFPPVNGAVDLAVREGGFNRMESIVSDTHNQLSWLVRNFHTTHGGKEYVPHLWTDPRVAVQKAKERQAQAEFQREVDEDIFGGIEW